MGAKGLRWSAPFNEDRQATFAAIAEWQSEKPQVKACRSALEWPPKHDDF
jgi:hypothetical protein